MEPQGSTQNDLDTDTVHYVGVSRVPTSGSVHCTRTISGSVRCTLDDTKRKMKSKKCMSKKKMRSRWLYHRY